MMKMDGRDSAKCRKSKFGDIDDIIGFVLNKNKTRLCIVLSPSLRNTSQNVGKKNRGDAVAIFSDFRES